MITRDKQIQDVNGIASTNETYYGLTTDIKPITGVGNGSCFIEMDSSKVYFFDSTVQQWRMFGS